MYFRIGAAMMLAFFKLIFDLDSAGATPFFTTQAGYPVDGIFALAGGVYSLLLATGYYPGCANDVTFQAWQANWGTPLKVVSPILIGLGVVQVAGLY